MVSVANIQSTSAGSGCFNAATSCWEVWVRVHPKASTTKALIDETNQLHLYVTVPPVEGAANGAVVKWFAKQLAVPVRCVVLRKGETAPLKCIAVQTVTEAQITTFWANLPQKTKNTD